MEKNRWIIGLIVIVLVVVGVSIWGFNKNKSGQTAGTSTSDAAPIYFSDTAPVMYFYQDNCIHCINQKKALEQLGEQGYRVKGMNAGKNVDYWTQYNISGTPTFVAANGDRLVGEQTYDVLKAWLDLHK